MGDANLCTKKWKESGFVYKNIYQVLNTTLERNDVRINMLPIHFMRVIIHFDTTVNIKAFVLKIVVK